MNRWVSLFFVVLAGTASASGDIWLGKNNFVGLSVASPRRQAAIMYPGDLSGVCGVELVTSRNHVSREELDALARELVVGEGIASHEPSWKPLDGAVDEMKESIRYPLAALGKYVTWVRIATKSGESLDALFNRLLPVGGLEHGDVSVILRPVPCGCAAKLAEITRP